MDHHRLRVTGTRSEWLDAECTRWREVLALVLGTVLSDSIRQTAWQGRIVKNYPNQLSDFARIRAMLALIDEMDQPGSSLRADSDLDLGYEMVRRRLTWFQRLARDASATEVEARIADEQLREPAKQAPQTTAREMRRTLHNFGWLDADAQLTDNGRALLASDAGSYDEQAALVRGLLGIAITDKEGNTHHPLRALLRLLAIKASYQREGLELALEPRDDSEAEFRRIARLYELPREERMAQLGISSAQRNNAVKIFPSLAITAGLVIKDSRWYSLSQDGWAVLGHAGRSSAAEVITKRRGRRVTTGKKVTSKTVAQRDRGRPPRFLSPAEQIRAGERLAERTLSHQALVRRVCGLIGDSDGDLFEDEFSYDLLWIPESPERPAYLFEMKSVTDATDAYARTRHAVGQLSYYDYFYVRPSVGVRALRRIAEFEADIPAALSSYLLYEKIGAIVSTTEGDHRALNQLGHRFLDELR